jgi:hypothetical protein
MSSATNAADEQSLRDRGWCALSWCTRADLSKRLLENNGCQTMKRVAICLLILASGCGGDPPSVPTAPPSIPVDAETPEVKDAGTTRPMTMDAGDDPLAPIVVFTAPSQATNPNDDTLVTEASLAVRCKVTRSTAAASSPIDKSAVQITMERPDDATKLIAPAVTALVDDEYQATFDLSAFANGPLHFHCTGKDLATKPHTATVALDTMVDLGPKIDFMEPKDKGIYTLKTPVSIRFQVSASKVGSTDVEDEIKQVKLNVGGVDTPVQESSTTPGLYQTSVNFDDHTKFPVPPTSAQMVVSVTDARTPTAATRSSKVDIIIDGDGPKIRVDDPPNRSIVHGVKELRLTVTDPSGIKPGSLVADINSGLLVITQWDGKEPSFSQKFDTRLFGTGLTQLTINITASDGVGNKATVSHQLRLDNLPPLLSLDPPYIREERMSGPNVYYCSAAFDPVGDLAANDLQRVYSSKRYRALVLDQTNHSVGAQVDYLAGVDPAKVVLYVQPDSSLPLLIDTDQDGVCDDINSLDLPEKDRPTQLQLLPVNPGGSAWYSKTIDTTNALHMAPRCIADPNGSDTAPNPICRAPATEMFRVVPGPSPTKPSAVYAVNPSNDDGTTGECAGGSWELVSIAKEGWLCMAARAEDNIGNIGVSAPLRICFDDGISGNGVPTCNVNEAPSCTALPPPSAASCTITAAQRFESGAIWPQQ